MDEPFHAVEAARQWRERVTGEVAAMSLDEKVAFFRRFSSVDVLKAKPIPTEKLPVTPPKQRKKGFDAVAESRKWREAASRKLAGMTPKQVSACLERQRAATPKKHAKAASS